MEKLNKYIFIVGNSRSGTTLLSRILSNHDKVFSFKEIHFFEKIVNYKKDKSIQYNESKEILSKLLGIQDLGLFNYKEKKEYLNEAACLLKKKKYNFLELYILFLNYIVKKNSSSISCEHTPNNIFYLDEILENIPNSIVINIVRDPRDVLLSQKNKWKRRFLGASKIPFKEVLRSYFNYHPLTISRIWNSSIDFSKKYINNKRVLTIKFEDLIIDPEIVIRKICSFTELDYDSKMLDVPVKGSSIVKDFTTKKGFDKSKIGRWQKGEISDAEIYICQKVTNKNMNFLNYKTKHFNRIPINVLFHMLSLPFKSIFSLFFNLFRVKNILNIIKKRIFIK